MVLYFQKKFTKPKINCCTYKHATLKTIQSKYVCVIWKNQHKAKFELCWANWADWLGLQKPIEKNVWEHDLMGQWLLVSLIRMKKVDEKFYGLYQVGYFCHPFWVSFIFLFLIVTFFRLVIALWGKSQIYVSKLANMWNTILFTNIPWLLKIFCWIRYNHKKYLASSLIQKLFLAAISKK